MAVCLLSLIKITGYFSFKAFPFSFLLQTVPLKLCPCNLGYPVCWEHIYLIILCVQRPPRLRFIGVQIKLVHNKWPTAISRHMLPNNLELAFLCNRIPVCNYFLIWLRFVMGVTLFVKFTLREKTHDSRAKSSSFSPLFFFWGNFKNGVFLITKSLIIRNTKDVNWFGNKKRMLARDRVIFIWNGGLIYYFDEFYVSGFLILFVFVWPFDLKCLQTICFRYTNLYNIYLWGVGNYFVVFFVHCFPYL